jgi:phage head maturation protease
MSFAFRVLEDQWTHEEPFTRTVLDMRVSEVSVVSFPAYQQTDVSVAKRSLEEFRATQPRKSVAWRTRELQILRLR